MSTKTTTRSPVKVSLRKTLNPYNAHSLNKTAKLETAFVGGLRNKKKDTLSFVGKAVKWATCLNPSLFSGTLNQHLSHFDELFSMTNNLSQSPL